MVRIDFHVNVPDTISYGCRLVRKVYCSGHRAGICCDDPARLAEFDLALWTFAPQEFVPHVMADNPLAAATPILLATNAAQLPEVDVLINLGHDPPADLARFPRLIELISEDEADRSAGRQRWRSYREQGYALHSHDLRAAQPKLEGDGP